MTPPSPSRRIAIGGGVAALCTAITQSPAAAQPGPAMYGLIGKITARPGQREALSAILAGSAEMPGCIHYLVAHDATLADVIWVTEVWSSKAAHAASLGLRSVKAAIARGRPLIAGMELVAELAPLASAGDPPA